MNRISVFSSAISLVASTLALASGCGDASAGADTSADASRDGGRDSAPSDTGSPGDAEPMRDTGTPPSGDGIASRYPGDEGIASDPDVLFFDDFESYGSDRDDLYSGWTAAVFNNAGITTEAAHVYRGTQALEFVSPRQADELSNGVARTLSPERDLVYLRFYSKFEATFDVAGSSHNGAGLSAHYFIDGAATPGIPADGTNKFLIEYECWREDESVANPGNLNLYLYHPEQRSQWGDHLFPDGTVLPNSSMPGDFGPEFVARPLIVPELDRWYAYELMVRANTPGLRDGRITIWLDGEVIGDFPNLRLRDVDDLKMDRVNLSLHIGSNTEADTRKWYDNVVVATSYIGPMAE